MDFIAHGSHVCHLYRMPLEISLMILSYLKISEIFVISRCSKHLREIAADETLGKATVKSHQLRLQRQVASLCNFDVDNQNEADSAFMRAFINVVEMQGLPLDSPDQAAWPHQEYSDFAKQWLRRTHNAADTQANASSAEQQIQTVTIACLDLIAIHLHYHQPGFTLREHRAMNIQRRLKKAGTLKLLRMNKAQLEQVLLLAEMQGLFTAAGSRSRAWFRTADLTNYQILDSSCDTITEYLKDSLGVTKPSQLDPYSFSVSSKNIYGGFLSILSDPKRTVTTLEMALLLENVQILPSRPHT
ncbi:hypothetical protein HII31_12622 [Pseudocercospora fuligena]|uniref:F-box domain-containing protein n=1 Tax=Pseudocercospora fuligena TaxID=685502 RepID=A0A8H6VBF2_9PEZI|nr:hypothetical protein HII31_12622 [Pseudocercospora fuligena]